MNCLSFVLRELSEVSFQMHSLGFFKGSAYFLKGPVCGFFIAELRVFFFKETGFLELSKAFLRGLSQFFYKEMWEVPFPLAFW